jgi:dihydropteroate synthase
MPRFRLGDVEHDLTTRTLVMAILNRTPDSFYDHGSTFALDALVQRAEELVRDGADILDIGGVKAGPGPEVGELEELDRVIPSVEAVRARFDVPISCDTWRASVLDAACAAGAVVRNDISGFADPEYLPWREARRVGGGDAHQVGAACPIPNRTTTTCRRRALATSRAARRAEAAGASGADRGRRRARPGQDPGDECRPPAGRRPT